MYPQQANTSLDNINFNVSVSLRVIHFFLSPLPPAAVAPSLSLSKLNPANLTSWTVEDVCCWLLQQDLGRFVEVFQENAVDGECLLTLDNNLLKNDLGIDALGHRSRILRRVSALKEQMHPQLT